MKAAAGFAVALKDPAAPPLAPLALLTAVEGYTKDSAYAFLRRQPGFLGRALTLEAAEELAAEAAQAGFGTIIAGESEIPVPPPPVKVLKLDIKENEFDITAGGIIKSVPFATVTVIGAAAYDAHVQPLSMEALKSGLFAKLMHLAGGEKFSPVSGTGPKETFFRADIMAENGELRLLLEPENMDFSTLGGARAHSSQQNFKAVLALLAARCPGAVRSCLLDPLLEGRPLAPFKYASAEACDAALSRLLLLAPRPAR